MAALSGLASSFVLKSHVQSSLFVRLHGGRICCRHGGASFVSPSCEAAFYEDYFTLSSPKMYYDKYRGERSNIVAISLCGPSTPVETREKLAVLESELPRAMEELCQLENIEEAAVLSTCTRMEIYVVAQFQDRGVSQVTDWVSKSRGVPVSEICKHRVLLYNKDAVKHLFEVSAGLELGESEITAQVMQVCKVGRRSNGIVWMMGMLFIRAMGVGKRVRRETGIGTGAVSLSSAAVALTLMKLSESSSSLAMARILVVGAGEMGKQVIKQLVARGCKKIVVVNRSEMSVAAIRSRIKGAEIIYKPLYHMYDCAADADVVFTTTTTTTPSGKPLFLKQHVEMLPPPPGKRVVRLFIDFSLPRNVGSCVASLGTARVYDLDDLKRVADAASNKEDRLREVIKARAIVDEQIERFEDLKDSCAMVPTVESQKALFESVRIAWRDKCLSRFGDDISEAQRKSIEDSSWDQINKQLKNAHAMVTRGAAVDRDKFYRFDSKFFEGNADDEGELGTKC